MIGREIDNAQAVDDANACAEAWKEAAEALEDTLHWTERLADSYHGDTRGLARLKLHSCKKAKAARKLEEELKE